jgi:hypothetical protein
MSQKAKSISQKEIDELRRDRVEKQRLEAELKKLKPDAAIAPMSDQDVIKFLQEDVKRERREKEEDRAANADSISKSKQAKEKGFINAAANNSYLDNVFDLIKTRWNWIFYMILHTGNLFNAGKARQDNPGSLRLVIVALVVGFIGYAYYVNNKESIATWQATPYAIPEVLGVLGVFAFFLSQEKYRKKLGI